jgi:hypothetical protein
MNSYFTIPTIVLSGLAGLGSVGAEQILPFTGASQLIGFVSFTAATLQTISSYYGFARRAESHRIAALSYEKLHRTLTFELSIPRAERTAPDILMKQLKEEADRLNEVSPQLPTFAIKLFKKSFPNTDHVAIPAILNGLEPIAITRDAQTVATPFTPAPPPPPTPVSPTGETRPPIRITVV